MRVRVRVAAVASSRCATPSPACGGQVRAPWVGWGGCTRCLTTVCHRHLAPPPGSPYSCQGSLHRGRDGLVRRAGDGAVERAPSQSSWCQTATQTTRSRCVSHVPHTALQPQPRTPHPAPKAAAQAACRRFLHQFESPLAPQSRGTWRPADSTLRRTQAAHTVWPLSVFRSHGRPCPRAGVYTLPAITHQHTAHPPPTARRDESTL